jgi:hypothetical protein
MFASFMVVEVFADDPGDRKRRFLRGLNLLLGHKRLADKNVRMSESIKISVPDFRKGIADFYGLELLPEEIQRMLEDGATTGDFTERYCPVIYQDRGNVDFGRLTESSMTSCGGVRALNLHELDRALKYGLNGSEWCDVAKGACSCGATH